MPSNKWDKYLKTPGKTICLVHLKVGECFLDDDDNWWMVVSKEFIKRFSSQSHQRVCRSIGGITRDFPNSQYVRQLWLTEFLHYELTLDHTRIEAQNAISDSLASV